MEHNPEIYHYINQVFLQFGVQMPKGDAAQVITQIINLIPTITNLIGKRDVLKNLWNEIYKISYNFFIYITIGLFGGKRDLATFNLPIQQIGQFLQSNQLQQLFQQAQVIWQSLNEIDFLIKFFFNLTLMI